MIVEPDIMTHPKFIRLRAEVGEVAMELLTRLWGHCHTKRGEYWENSDENYVNFILYSGNIHGNSRQTWFKALEKCGWLTIYPDGIVIHDWNSHNKSLISRWNKPDSPRKASVRGSTQASTQTPKQTPAQIATQMSTQTPAQVSAPSLRPDGTDVTGVEGGTHPPAAPTGTDPDPDSAVGGFGEVNCPPSKTEVLRYAEKTGIPPHVALNFFDHYASTNWCSGSTRITDFRPRLDKWNRGEPGNATGPTPANASSTAGRIGLERTAVVLRERIARDPANPESASGIANPTDAQKNDYRAAKSRLREIENQLMNV